MRVWGNIQRLKRMGSISAEPILWPMGSALEAQQFVNSALFLKFTWHIPVVKAVQLYRMRFSLPR